MPFAVILTLVVGLAMPATAQQSSEQEARQAGESIVQAYNKAGQSKDAAGLAAVYTLLEHPAHLTSGYTCWREIWQKHPQLTVYPGVVLVLIVIRQPQDSPEPKPSG